MPYAYCALRTYTLAEDRAHGPRLHSRTVRAVSSRGGKADVRRHRHLCRWSDVWARFRRRAAFALETPNAGFIHSEINHAVENEREGSAPFVYPLAKNHPGRPSRHFWRLPERLYDDPDELAVWAGRALAIAEQRKGSPRGRAKKKATSKKRG